MLFADLAAWGLASWMNDRHPARTDEGISMRLDLARAIVTITSDDHEQRLLGEIAWWESAYRRDVATCKVLGPEGEEGPWQNLPGVPSEKGRVCASLENAARIALGKVRQSLVACSTLPAEERLAVYARGRCDSVDGRRLSRRRWVD